MTISYIFRLGLCVASAAVLAGCGNPDFSGNPEDPYEVTSRRNHEVNKTLDQNVLRPVALSYAAVVPDPIERGLSNFADNQKTLTAAANNILQGRAEDAIHNTMRFAANTVFGFAGLLDVATEMGLEERESGFGETLYVWGVPEGPYRELVILGPGIRRHRVGRVVDFITNPTRAIIPPSSEVSTFGTGATVGDFLTARDRADGTIQDVIFGSADSYATTRLFYLENRRFELGADGGSPYVDPYGDGPSGTDPSSESFVDPYAELDSQ